LICYELLIGICGFSSFLYIIDCSLQSHRVSDSFKLFFRKKTNIFKPVNLWKHPENVIIISRTPSFYLTSSFKVLTLALQYLQSFINSILSYVCVIYQIVEQVPLLSWNLWSCCRLVIVSKVLEHFWVSWVPLVIDWFSLAKYSSSKLGTSEIAAVEKEGRDRNLAPRLSEHWVENSSLCVQYSGFPSK